MQSALKVAVVGLAVTALVPLSSAQPPCGPSTPLTPISKIQGSYLRSTMQGEIVRVQGVVTAVSTGTRNKNFQIQSLDSDADNKDETSEGITVYYNVPANLPSDYQTPTALDIVTLCGEVTEFVPSQPDGSQPSTQIVFDAGDYLAKTGTGELPTPIVIGAKSGGKVRTPPELIYNSKPKSSSRKDVSLCQTKECALKVKQRSLDFWESLENMVVTIQDPLVVAGVDFGDVFVVPAGGSLSGNDLNARCGVTISGTSNANADFNGEIVKILEIKDGISGLDCSASTGSPDECVTIGDRLASATGVVLYDFGNYGIKLVEPTSVVSRIGPNNQACADAVEQETTLDVSPGDLTIATYNILNFSGPKSGTPEAKIAVDIVQRLKSPAIIALQEVQDNNGDKDDEDCDIVDGDTNGKILIDAIIKAKGPATYKYIEIDPVGCKDGGSPGGNIRPAFLYDSARVTLADSTLGRAGTNSEVTKPELVGGKVQLSLNPGLASLATAFDNSRKSLVAHFVFTPPGGGAARDVYAISNHFSSKSGSDPLYGAFQPPANGAEAARIGQAEAILAFVKSIVALDSGAGVVVAGDLNEFTDFPALQALSAGGVLTDLLTKLPPAEQYTYNFNGNSQALDHIYVTKSLFPQSEVDVIHSNSGIGFGFFTSDHDPVLAKIVSSSARKARRALA